ncbi:MAG: CHAD domain-containing protein [Gammaproteobacteria bacterium]|nr:CHAD domain-containing protein [Gammaproteobacteria bacterium]
MSQELPYSSQTLPPTPRPAVPSLQSLAAAILQAQVYQIDQQLGAWLETPNADALHEARIAIRRTRALLPFLKHSLSKQLTRPLAQGMRWLQSATSHQRDLDVLLGLLRKQMRGEFKKSITYSMLSSLLARDIADEQHRVRIMLESEVYRDLRSHWVTSLAALLSPAPQDPRALRFIHKIIRASYDDFRRAARNALRKPTPRRIHDVRILGKQLRYQLEAFPHAYDPERREKLLARLKKLQNALGAFCDLEAQVVLLKNWRNELRHSPRKHRGAGRELRRLQKRRRRERAAIKAKACKALQKIAAPKSHKRCKKLLRGREASASGGGQ